MTIQKRSGWTRAAGKDAAEIARCVWMKRLPNQKRLGCARAWLMALTLAFTVSTAHAVITCSGMPTYLAVNSVGHVYVNVGYGVWAICNVSQTTTVAGTSITTETCRAWYASLLAQQKAAATVVLYFNEHTSCSSIGSWVVPTPLPYHIDIYQ